MNREFASSDLGLSGALKSLQGTQLLRVEPIDARRVAFVFADDGTINEKVEAYWNGKLQVDALAYFNALKLLKAQVFSVRRV
ncbi:MAG: DUF5659 domain-containing protein [bacterium]|nr:DUF5659 domain-containing protein [bacterium]